MRGPGRPVISWPLNVTLPRRGASSPAMHLEAGRFAGAVRPDDRDDLARADRQRDAFQNLVRGAVPGDEVVAAIRTIVFSRDRLPARARSAVTSAKLPVDEVAAFRHHDDGIAEFAHQHHVVLDDEEAGALLGKLADMARR